MSLNDVVLAASFVFSLVSFALVYYAEIVGPKIRLLLPRDGMKIMYDMPSKGPPHYKFWDGKMDEYKDGNDFGNCNMPLQVVFANDGSNAGTVTEFDIQYPNYPGPTKRIWDFLNGSERDIVVPSKGACALNHNDSLRSSLEFYEHSKRQGFLYS